MKNYISLVLLVLVSVTSSMAQNLVAFTTSALDTHWVSEHQIVQITKTTAGSNLFYIDEVGDPATLAIRERSVDTANVAGSVTITFAGSAGSVDSIVINGVEIMNGTVAFTSNLSTTLGLVEDSIDNNTQSPVNYSATNTATTVTISAPAAFGDTANGYVVTVYTSGGITVTSANPTVVGGGFTVVRNILTLTDRVFNIEGGAKALNADRVEVLKKSSTGGSVITYEGAPKGQIRTTTTPAAITASIKAL